MPAKLVSTAYSDRRNALFTSPESARVLQQRDVEVVHAGAVKALEKTSRYMGYGTAEIGPLLATSKQPVAISGVCAVFAESEVINQLSLGSAPSDIMLGAIVSLVDRSVQLMKRVQMEPEFTLIGGILRFETMARVVREHLKSSVNVPPESMVQFIGALGAAVLGQRRIAKLGANAGSPVKVEC